MNLSTEKYKEACVELFNDLTDTNNSYLTKLAKKYGNQDANSIDASALLKLTCIVWSQLGIGLNKPPKEILGMFREELRLAWKFTEDRTIDPELN